MIEGLEKCGGIDLVPAPPAHLIDLLLGGDIDLGLVSLIDAQRSPEPLAIFPVGMIGCDGPTLTVRLFSRRPIGELERVHVDSESHTSVALLRIVMRDRYGRAPEMMEFRARNGIDGAAEAYLVIGDKVVTRGPSGGAYAHTMDLGEAWKEMTGLPFVYAAWMSLASRAEEPGVRAAAILLDRQRRHNTMRTDWIAARRAEEHAWPTDLARTYLGERLRFDVDARAMEAIDRFFELAERHGVIGSQRPVEWVAL